MATEKESAIAQLQEIFGITITEAENSYQFYKNDLNEAIQGLASRLEHDPPLSLEQAVEKSPTNRGSGDGSSGVEATCSPNPDGDTTPTPSGTSNNPIDLTQDDDLQKALALSLQDMQHQNGGISLEEQELSRALEASIADTQSESERLGITRPFFDPLNPHERKRIRDIPIGLKNIGNTCWFSSVIQSLFNIPVFRECIINYEPNKATTDKLPQCVLFVMELQKLFALLLQSNQRYINPKAAIDLLHSVFSENLGGQQQDVSEFTHKLLEWIEDAFTFSQDKDQPNPMIQLFTGQCITQGELNGQPFVNHSRFGAFPVQIEGHTHLHDSLEAVTDNTEMKQETWFTHLPPVLVLELSRFKYNQTTGQAEKIHDQLTFDKIIYLDRYLHSNIDKSRECRREVGMLRQRLRKFEKMLKSYTNFCGKNIAINDVLSLAFKFVDTHDVKKSHDLSADQEDGIQTVNGEEGPAPRSGSETEMAQVKKHLQQWMSEMNAEISGEAIFHKLLSLSHRKLYVSIIIILSFFGMFLKLTI